MTDQLLASIIVVAIMLLVGFPVHEFSHALAAYRLGDSTARHLGRLTLNPIVHFDPLGGILLAVTMIGNTGFAFGWAKPTPVNPRNLEGGRYGEAIVAAAGPISNLVLAIAAAIPLRYILSSPSLLEQIPTIVLQVLFFFILINLVLMVFNLFPIPPLDGSKVLFAFLPPQVAWRWRPILEQYGFILLLLVFFVPPGDSIGGKILVPIIDALLDLLVGR
ncbi:MAG TPA: site-2 protease family protein [Candidatus Limnocylindrales bacterium]|nr:site-2 protease family protein [Candidatus Limnocylindrales bacterium]